jgi:sec-independent protein translocase protein TatB
MFDVSFSELLVIAIVALLVIGPEKLPKVARTVGAFTGRMQRYMAQIKEEVNRETRFEELQKLQQEIKQSVESAVERETDALQASILKPSRPVKNKTAETKPKKVTSTKRVSAKSAAK